MEIVGVAEFENNVNREAIPSAPASRNHAAHSKGPEHGSGPFPLDSVPEPRLVSQVVNIVDPDLTGGGVVEPIGS